MTPNVFTIFTGDDKTMAAKVVSQGCNSDPIDLTTCTAIDVALPKADGTFAHLTLDAGDVAIISAVLGKFNVTIGSVVSALLNPGEYQNFDVTFTISDKKITVRFNQALSVFEQ
jgi:hypothetical protein